MIGYDFQLSNAVENISTFGSRTRAEIISQIPQNLPDMAQRRHFNFMRLVKRLLLDS